MPRSVDFGPRPVRTVRRAHGPVMRLSVLFAGKLPITLQTGITSHIPAGEMHNVRSTGATGPLKLLVFWVAEKGQPLTVPVK